MKIANLLNNNLLKFIIFLLILLGCFSLGKFFNVDIERFRHYFLQFPIIISGIIFIVLYVVLTFFILFGPKDVLRLTGAIVYGPYTSTVIVWIAESINAFVLFNLSRKLGKDFVEQKFRLRSKDLEQAQKGSGFWESIVLRINPLISFRIMDLGAGLSRVNMAIYLTAVIIVSPIRIFWLQYILSDVGTNLFKDPKSMIEYFKTHQGVLFYSTIYFLIVGVLSVTLIIVKAFKKRRKVKGEASA